MDNTGITFRIIETSNEASNNQAVNDLDAVTNYSVKVMVRNNQGFQTNTTIKYETGELGEHKFLSNVEYT